MGWGGGRGLGKGKGGNGIECKSSLRRVRDFCIKVVMYAWLK